MQMMYIAEYYALPLSRVTDEDHNGSEGGEDFTELAEVEILILGVV